MSRSFASMPKMLYGTAWKKEATAELVAEALDVGFRGIDTAAQPKHYNEKGKQRHQIRIAMDLCDRRNQKRP